jgi:hypothetical protein
VPVQSYYEFSRNGFRIHFVILKLWAHTGQRLIQTVKSETYLWSKIKKDRIELTVISIGTGHRKETIYYHLYSAKYLTSFAAQ